MTKHLHLLILFLSFEPLCYLSKKTFLLCNLWFFIPVVCWNVTLASVDECRNASKFYKTWFEQPKDFISFFFPFKWTIISNWKVVYTFSANNSILNFRIFSELGLCHSKIIFIQEWQFIPLSEKPISSVVRFMLLKGRVVVHWWDITEINTCPHPQSLSLEANKNLFPENIPLM